MILNIIARLLHLLISLSGLNLLAVLIKYGFKWKVVNGYYKSSAIDIDKFGGRDFRTLWNGIFITKESKNRFGNFSETMSSVLGKNQRDRTLTYGGLTIMYLLWAIDIPNWRNGGHCIASISQT